LFRMGRWDAYAAVQYMTSEDIHFETDSGPLDMSMDDTALLGFGFGYHVGDNLLIHFDLLFGDTEIGVAGAPEGGQRDTSLDVGQVAFDWNFFKTRFTPFLTGGLGWQYLEAEIDAPPVPVYYSYSYDYYDPWYGDGYYTLAQPVYTETDLIAFAGGGFRWNVTDNFVMRFSVDANWLEYDDSVGNTMQVRGTFTIGGMF
jgi:hypothetical protein